MSNNNGTTNGITLAQRQHLARLIRRGRKLVKNQAFGEWYAARTDCACAGGMAVLAAAEAQGIDSAILKRNWRLFREFRDTKLPKWMRLMLRNIVVENDKNAKSYDVIADEIATGSI